MTPSPYQPLRFNNDLDCHLSDGGFVLKAIDGDVTQFQFALDNCLADGNIIRNGSFTEAGGIGTGWNRVGPTAWSFEPYFGRVIHVFGSTLGWVHQDVIIAQGQLCQLTVTINQRVGTSYVAFVSGGAIVQYQSFTGIVSQTVSIWVLSSSNVIDGILLGTTTANSDVSFGQVRLVPINTRLKADVVDLAGAVVYDDIPYNVNNGWATFTMNWEGLALGQGCYRVNVYDPCDCGQNGLVALDMQTGCYPSAVWDTPQCPWSIGASWTVGGGSAEYTGVSVPNTNSIFTRNSPLCVGVQYQIRYRVVSLANAQVRVACGSTSGTWRTTTGTYTETLTPTVSGSLSFVAQSVGVAGSVTIDNVELVAVERNATFVSEVISYRPMDDGDCCTRLLSICNDTDAFDMGFIGTGFTPSVRMECQLSGGTYPTTRNKYRDSFGAQKVYFGRTYAVRDLIYEAPTYVHDFLNLALIADHFFVEGVEYEVEPDEYPTPSRNTDDDLSWVTLPISLATENMVNRRVSSTVRGCGIDGATLGVDQKPIVGGSRPKPDLSTSTDGQVITLDG